ncbi:hypothetical protein HPP92_013443 [Vanilla planifolia]|uniref:Fe2OG dioxygenase domain-containing protein n=1 Tax=Vanilla planifolia TaxID=51239 RepID=A0A835QYL5_VANPL|nr:hypothetical protein HPP92_013443 [Vanilla planifolia]
MDCLKEWPETIVRVQSISDSGAAVIPPRYIKPLADRPCLANEFSEDNTSKINIPVVDLSADDAHTISAVSAACREWGFFHAVNHGVNPELLHRAREVWREFFHLPWKPSSRLGIEKGAILDWGDYYFLHFFPLHLKSHEKWPALPPSLRETVDEYGRELVRLSERVMGFLSMGMGLEEGRLRKAFGDKEAGVCMRVNYYPKCPQPDLTLGLSSHSDPGGITLLLPDNKVKGLQVRHGDSWVTVKPVADAFIINIGDQVQVLSNATYRSVEHRVVVNSNAERLSIAFFYNPRSDLLIGPMPEMVNPTRPALYQPMTFDEYRLFIRKRGPRGKSQVESLKST